jgi:hypothetical protein
VETTDVPGWKIALNPYGILDFFAGNLITLFTLNEPQQPSGSSLAAKANPNEFGVAFLLIRWILER